MKKIYSLVTTLLLLALLTACSNTETSKESSSKQPVDLTVSAAASLQDALVELQKTYEKEHTDVNVQFNFGGSGALKQQIAQGAPVDVFFSAASEPFDALVQSGDIEKSKQVNLLANELVLITPKDTNNNIQSFKDLTTAKKIALGTPESVPAGQYGRETLEALKLWTRIEDKIVYTKDVRQVLTYVESGNVDAGLVYETDARTSDKVQLVATAKSDTHQPIIYPVGIIKDSKHPKEAQAFYDFLQSDEAMKTFEKYGFKGAK